MKIIRAAAFFCSFLFALSAFAQNPSGQGNSGQAGSSSGQTGMGQSSTSQTGAAQSGNAQSGTAQSNSQSGMGQSNNGAAPQPGQSDQSTMRAPDQSEVQSRIDAQVKVLTDQLTLNDDQQAKTRTILVDQHDQAMTIVKDSALSRDDKVQKIHNLRESTISKVRSTLNDDQKKKFDVMVSEQNERMRQMQGGNPGSSGPGSSSPGNDNSNSNTNPPKNNSAYPPK